MWFVGFVFFFSSRRRHTRCALVTGVQTCALPIYRPPFWDQWWAAARAGTEFAFVRQVAHARATDHQSDRRRHGGRISTSSFEGLHQPQRSEEHTSELQSLMRISYAVFCLTQNKTNTQLTSAVMTTRDSVLTESNI